MSDRFRELTAAPRVAPSILSADFAKLGAQVEEVMAAGARVIHVDIMDGHFVPPITIGPLVAGAVADLVHDAGGAIDVHMMIEAPERQIEEFAKAGADSITFHAEATPHANRTLAAIRELGCCAGIAINPGTPVEAVSELRGLADLVLCMTVNPGQGRAPDAAGRRRRDRGRRRRRHDHGGPDRRRRRLAVRRRLRRIRRRRPRRRLPGDRPGRRRFLRAVSCSLWSPHVHKEQLDD
jgi:hypothetical protein